MGQRVGRVTKGRLDVLESQARIRAQEVCFRRSLAQFSEDQFHRDSRPTDHRFAHHDIRIDLDAVHGGH